MRKKYGLRKKIKKIRSTSKIVEWKKKSALLQTRWNEEKIRSKKRSKRLEKAGGKEDKMLEKGVEPLHLAVQDPKSCASANSATRACFVKSQRLAKNVWQGK